MALRAIEGGRVCVTVSQAVPINDLLERLAINSAHIHALTTAISQSLGSLAPPPGLATPPRLGSCHTSSLATPSDKQQALQLSEAHLLSLARSLLQAWAGPLLLLSTSTSSLPPPAQRRIATKIQELQEHSLSLDHGLDLLVNKMGPAAQTLFLLPYRRGGGGGGGGGGVFGGDMMSTLVNFNFLLSCLRRDSHKIDSFLKVLRCRAAKTNAEIC